jgi:hypothetical protein
VEANVAAKLAFVARLKELPIAINTPEANEQHYEVPTEFYQLCLGKRLKYSSCYYPPGRPRYMCVCVCVCPCVRALMCHTDVRAVPG